MKLLFIIESMGGGGAQRVLASLTAAFADHGHNVQVITFNATAADVMKLHPDVVHHRLSHGGASQSLIGALRANAARISALRRLIRSEQPDVVIGLIGSTNILAILATLGTGIPVVISERNDPSRQSLGKVWDLLRRMLYRMADAITANSSAALRTMRTYVPERKLKLIPNPLPPMHVNRARLASPPFILAVGRLHRQKGFDILLTAFSKFAGRNPDWQLRILGEGPERDALVAQVARLGLASKVSFLGFRKPDDFYDTCRFFVLPSRFEGVPNVLLEAMGSGCPVIVTSSQSGSLDYVRSGETGLVVPTEDVTALDQAMEMLAQDPVMAEELGRAAHAAVAELLPERISNEWLSLFRSILRS